VIRTFVGILNIFVFALAATGQPSWIEEGLIAHYPSDGNTVDQSGNGHDGVIIGNATLEVVGGLLFDEPGDRLQLTFSAGSEEITYSLFYTPKHYFDGSEDWLTVLARE